MDERPEEGEDSPLKTSLLKEEGVPWEGEARVAPSSHERWDQVDETSSHERWDEVDETPSLWDRLEEEPHGTAPEAPERACASHHKKCPRHKNRMRLKEAMIWKEILDSPVGLRS